jgi:hypothetical protein
MMIRRVITGNDEQGRSYVVSDEEVTELGLWRSVEGDPLSDKAGGTSTQMLPSTAPHVEPPRGGSRAMHVTVRPWKEIEATAGQGGAPRLDAKVFHRTITVDHIMMISGEVTLLLDIGEATLRAGDMLVQRNTNHAWLNRTDQPARFWAVMVPLTPA